MTSPLDGLRVVELAEGIAAPYACQQLRALGAEVIKVESPRGDWLRTTGRESFRVVNKGKRAICVDAKSVEGAGVLWRLIDGADVLVSNYRPAALDRLGVTADTVAARAPHIVFAHLTAYAHDGPLAARGGTDTILQAESGIMDQIGEPQGPPTRVGFPLIDLVAARDIATGVCAALVGRSRGVTVRYLPVSLFAVASTLLLQGWQERLIGLPAAGRAGNRNAVHAPGGVYSCADGTSLALVLLRDYEWPVLCEVLGEPRLAAEPRYASNDSRILHRDALEADLGELLRTRTAHNWLPHLTAAGLLAGPVNTVLDVQSDSGLYGVVPVVETRSSDGRDTGAVLATTFETRADGPVAGAPAIGEHADVLLAELGCLPAEIAALRTGGALGDAEKGSAGRGRPSDALRSATGSS